MIKKRKKIFARFGALIVLAIAVIAVLAPLSEAHALALTTADRTKLNFLSCIDSPFSCAVYGATFIINSFASLLIMLGGWMVKTSLVQGSNVLDSPTVRTGFGVMLSLANLGFVLGIIVIAIATILRNQSYGVKQALWRLLVMAILVNFSLVIAGALINFSNELTVYFVDQATPGGYDGFAGKLTDGFAPQKLLEPPSYSGAPLWRAILNKIPITGPAINALTGDLSSFDTFIKAVLSMIFSIIFSFLIAFTLWAIGIMLAIRYVYLTILLILMPIAWLLWVFPVFKNQWAKWWDKFIKWTFFAPLSVFFLYLALFIVLNRPEGALPPVSEVDAGVAVILNNPNFAQTAGEMISLIFLAWGGLFAANSLSIRFADTAMTTAKSVGKWAQGATGRKAAQYTSAPLRAGKAGEQMGKFAARQTNPLLRAVTGLAARGVQRFETAGGAKVIDNYQSGMKNQSLDEVATRHKTGLFEEERIAAAIELLSRNEGGKVDLSVLSEQSENAFQRFGQGKQFRNMELEKGVGSTAYEKLMHGTAEEFLKAAKEFHGGVKDYERSKVGINSLFERVSSKEELEKKFPGLTLAQVKTLQESSALALALESPASIAGYMAKMNRGTTLRHFAGDVFPPAIAAYQNDLAKEQQGLEKELDLASTLPEGKSKEDELERLDALQTDLGKRRDNIKEVFDNFKTSKANVALGFGAPPQAEGAGTKPAAPPPTVGRA